MTTNKERILARVLRFAAVVMLLAVGSVIMPFAWMDGVHRQLGMGVLPNLPILQYLTRSASALYAGYGALLYFLSLDVRRYQPVIVFKAWLGMGLGSVLLGLDVAIGMPWFWSLAEGPTVIGINLVILWLARGPGGGSSLPDRGLVNPP